MSDAELIKENATFLAKILEDPYSEALMQVIKLRIELLEDLIHHKSYGITSNNLYHLLGQLFALKEVVRIPELAREELDALPDEVA